MVEISFADFEKVELRVGKQLHTGSAWMGTLTCVEEGDNVLVPDLGYPVYGQATIRAGGEPRPFGEEPAGTFVAERGSLIASEMHPKGARYTTVESYPFGGTG